MSRENNKLVKYRIAAFRKTQNAYKAIPAIATRGKISSSASKSIKLHGIAKIIKARPDIASGGPVIIEITAMQTKSK